VQAHPGKQNSQQADSHICHQTLAKSLNIIYFIRLNIKYESLNIIILAKS
jgi:hypothetical protein